MAENNETKKSTKGPRVMTEEQMLKLATRIAKLDKAACKLVDDKMKLMESLLPEMIEKSIKEIPVPDFRRSVCLKHDTSRHLTKKGIVERWGQEAAEYFDSLTPNDRYYLSISKHDMAEKAGE